MLVARLADTHSTTTALTGRVSTSDTRPVNGHIWWATPLAIGAVAMGLDLTHAWVTMAAIAAILAAGLPHGAHDLALAQRLGQLAHGHLIVRGTISR